MSTQEHKVFWPLMKDCITDSDKEAMIDFLKNNSRITYDTNIIYRTGIKKSNKFYNSNKVIIEFKLDDSQKLKESYIFKNLMFSERISIENRLFGNPEKFSKYVDSVEKLNLINENY